MIGAGPVLLAVARRLEERWTAAAARTLTSAQGYGVPTDALIRPPERILPYLTEDRQHWPVAFVIPGEARPGEQTGRRITRDQEVVVIWEDDRPTTEDLAWSLLLSEATVIDALTGPGQPEPPIYSLVWSSTSPGPVFQLTKSPDSRAWHSYVEISFTAKLVEEETL